MSSSSRTAKNLSVFTPKKIHFVTIIMNDVMRNQKLVKKFERKHRIGFSKSVLLKVPSGEAWKVALSKLNGQVYFQDGWEKFSDYYSIDYVHFIVFEYEGNSQFSVFIIDKSATEINYPFKNKEGNFGSARSDMDEVSLDLEETLNSSLDFHPRKPVGTDSAKAADVTRFSSMDSEGIKGKTNLGSSSKGVSGKQAGEKRHQGGILLRNQPSGADGNAEAPDGNTVPDNIPRFTIQMLETHLPPRSTLSIPSWFAAKYLTEEEVQVTLTVLNEVSWLGKYRVCKTRERSRVRLKEGWGIFAQMNVLAVVDICSFDLLESDKVLFQVSISQPNQKII